MSWSDIKDRPAPPFVPHDCDDGRDCDDTCPGCLARKYRTAPRAPTVPPARDPRQVLIDYLLCCVDRGEWREVCNAANDLRVLEAREQVRMVKP